MKRLGKLLLLLLLLAVNISLFWQLKNEFNRWQRRNDHFVTQPLYGSPLGNLSIFERDRQGTDILIGTFPEFQDTPGFKQIILFSPWGKTYKQMSFFLHVKVPRNRYYSPPVDVNGDGRVEIPLFWIEDRQIHCEIRNFAGKVIASHALQPLSMPIPADNISWNVLAISDIDRDGRLETILSISGEFFGPPRGIAVHDLETGRRKWEYLIGATPFQAEVVDIDGDGRKEIVFSAWAPHNGYAYNGTNDDTSYLGVLDSAGKLALAEGKRRFFFRDPIRSRRSRRRRKNGDRFRPCLPSPDRSRSRRGQGAACRQREGQRRYFQASRFLFPAVHRRRPRRTRARDRHRRLLRHAGDPEREAANPPPGRSSANRSRSWGCALSGKRTNR